MTRDGQLALGRLRDLAMDIDNIGDLAVAESGGADDGSLFYGIAERIRHECDELERPA